MRLAAYICLAALKIGRSTCLCVVKIVSTHLILTLRQPLLTLLRFAFFVSYRDLCGKTSLLLGARPHTLLSKFLFTFIVNALSTGVLISSRTTSNSRHDLRITRMLQRVLRVDSQPIISFHLIHGFVHVSVSILQFSEATILLPVAVKLWLRSFHFVANFQIFITLASFSHWLLIHGRQTLVEQILRLCHIICRRLL